MQKNQYPPMVVPPSGALRPWEIDTFDLSPERRVHLRDYLHILAKRKRWIIGIFLGVVLVTAAVVFLMTPIYRATALLQITQDNAIAQVGENDPLAALKGGQELTRFQETQVRIQGSRSLAWRPSPRQVLQG